MMDLAKGWKKLTRKFLDKIQGDSSEAEVSCLIEAAAVSHQGKIRENNEDNLYFQGRILPVEHGGTQGIWSSFPGPKLTAAVFDGMGGEAAGELASYTAAQGMKEFMEREKHTPGDASGHCRKESIDTAAGIPDPGQVSALCLGLNRGVVDAARQGKYSCIGTTAVLAFLTGREYLVANLGDSPAYLFREGELSMLTRPHTNARSLERQGFSGRKPGLTQFLGIPEEELLLEPHLVRGELEPEDQLLLCSDGLTDMVPESEIAGILQEKQPAKVCVQRLLDVALERGGRDNITIILCKIQREET